MQLPRPLNAQEQYLYALNAKIDTLIDLLTPKAPPAPPAEKPVVKQAPPRKTRKKKEV